MVIGSSKRRRYLFRVDPGGLVAIRVGNPFAFFAFFGIVSLFLLTLWEPMGIGALFAGAALGLAALGLLERGIARGVATQPKETVLKLRMNHFLPREALASARIEDAGVGTNVRLVHEGHAVRITIIRAGVQTVREALDRYSAS